MQRAWTDRRRRITILIISLIVLAVCIASDLITKAVFKDLFYEQGETVIIDGFFYLTFTENSGSAFSFLSDAEWAQIFFKVLTSVALVGFVFFYLYALKGKYKVLSIGLALVIGGTIGNFVDRLAFNKVRDFIGFIFGSYRFPIFNLADTYLTIGVIMLLVHFLFLDKSALFRKKNGKDKLQG